LDIQLTTYVVSLNSITQRVASVCHRHGATTGSPSDLERLLRQLQRNKHLAMDFWSAVSQMSVPLNPPGMDSDPSPVVRAPAPSARMLQQLALEAIVRAITGLSVFEMMSVGGDPPRAVVYLASLLAGSDLEYDTADLEFHTVIDAAKPPPASAIEMPRGVSASQPPTCEGALDAGPEQENPLDRRQETALISADSTAPTTMDCENEPAKDAPDWPRALASEIFIPEAALAPPGDNQLRHIFGPAAMPKPAAGWHLFFRPHMWLRRQTPTLPR
jgi:hypothetical protein